MKKQLRNYQLDMKNKVYSAWDAQYKAVLLRMPTGSGKTVTFCSIVDDTKDLTTAIIVHRKELVQQICLTLADEEIEHNIIAARKDIRGIINAERAEYKRSFYNPNSKVTVISVDTLISRQEIYKQWLPSVNQVIIDECTHVLKENKWGKATALFPNARVLGVTATPERLDKKGLGSHVDGIFDVMVEGPSTRWMIDNGYLCKYKIAIPESDYNNYLKKSSNNSDYSKKSMMEASTQSQITGDVVDNYIKHAHNKQCIVFATDVATAKRMQANFLAKGINAKELNGTTNDKERLEALIKFRSREIKVLINVDLFDEGLDVPGIECVSMCRPTKSLGKYLQMIGRGLRTAPGKEYLILIDHVGNVQEHGLACADRLWTLDRIKKSQKKLNFLRICSNTMCNAPYDRALTECPWCGTDAITVTRAGEGGGRTPPIQVDGDLMLIDPETIRELEQRASLEAPARVAERVAAAMDGAAGLRALKNQQERIGTQKELSMVIATWAGEMKAYYGYSDRMIHKKFYLFHNMTITEALGMPKKDMLKMIDRVGDYR